MQETGHGDEERLYRWCWKSGPFFKLESLQSGLGDDFLKGCWWGKFFGGYGCPPKERMGWKELVLLFTFQSVTSRLDHRFGSTLSAPHSCFSSPRSESVCIPYLPPIPQPRRSLAHWMEPFMYLFCSILMPPYPGPKLHARRLNNYLHNNIGNITI